MDKKNYFSEDNGFGKFKNIAIELIERTDQLLCEVDHCLICGTLLGFVRHNDLIPWDDDLDILVDSVVNEYLEDMIRNNQDLVFLRKSSELIRICFKDKGNIIEGDLYHWKKNVLSPDGFYRWPFIDLFLYEKKSDHIEFFHKKWNNEEFFPFRKESFLGLSVNIPKNPNYFLQNNYGKGYLTTLKSSHFSHKDEKRKINFSIKMDEYKLLFESKNEKT
jgi:phosphorylcholine metabolism protein LicD